MGTAGAGARGQEHPGGRARAAVCGQDGAVLVDGSLKAWEVTPFHHRFFSSDCTHGAGAAAAPVPPHDGCRSPPQSHSPDGALGRAQHRGGGGSCGDAGGCSLPRTRAGGLVGTSFRPRAPPR